MQRQQWTKRRLNARAYSQSMLITLCANTEVFADTLGSLYAPEHEDNKGINLLQSNKNEGMDIDDGGKGKKEEKNAEEEWPKIVNAELRTQLLKSSINSELSFAGENPFFNPDQ